MLSKLVRLIYFSRPYAVRRHYQKSQARHRTGCCSGHLCFCSGLAGCAACFSELSLVSHLSIRDPFVTSCTTFGWWGFTGAKVPTSHILHQGGQQGCSCLHRRSMRKVGSEAHVQSLGNTYCVKLQQAGQLHGTKFSSSRNSPQVIDRCI